MIATVVSDGFWDVIEPLLPLPKPKPQGGRPRLPIEPASGVFCLSFVVEFLGRCCRRSWAVPPGEVLPRIRAGGFNSEQEVASLPGARRVETLNEVPGPSPAVSAFYRGTAQRNLYRIPIP